MPDNRGHPIPLCSSFIDSITDENLVTMTAASPSTSIFSSNTANRSEPGPHEQVTEIEKEQVIKKCCRMKYLSDCRLYASTISVAS